MPPRLASRTASAIATAPSRSRTTNTSPPSARRPIGVTPERLAPTNSVGIRGRPGTSIVLKGQLSSPTRASCHATPRIVRSPRTSGPYQLPLAHPRRGQLEPRPPRRMTPAQRPIRAPIAATAEKFWITSLTDILFQLGSMQGAPRWVAVMSVATQGHGHEPGAARPPGVDASGARDRMAQTTTRSQDRFRSSGRPPRSSGTGFRRVPPSTDEFPMLDLRFVELAVRSLLT